ncbi:Holliday junction branch migration protein RuvA [Actinocrinis puniceicyclus]|uniref:Holliday junction branch migration complex subunit RuvA n=1 Tax=Actinocrinis puniceicyclus TaxID=977794 RepID=A0A8J8BCL1_9ACTN|nr:Holliday junction branch migration protein RuvA [Actinocrinis puniceicyclus]MBS2965212.1 Holliday junction branch migration protein RuvA [Actinocrinis puniceicyclus]
MIAFVEGEVDAVAPDAAVVKVGGVGLLLHCSPGTLAQLTVGQKTRLAASLIVREDSLTLYGFPDDDERTVFELLQTASGVGPRLAQAMLATHRPDTLRTIFATQDLKALTLVPGIGPKGAQKLLIELKGRLGAPSGVPAQGGSTGAATTASPGVTPWRGQLLEALTGLGWTARDAEAALAEVEPVAAESESRGESPQLPVLLRAALRSLKR